MVVIILFHIFDSPPWGSFKRIWSVNLLSADLPYFFEVWFLLGVFTDLDILTSEPQETLQTDLKI